MQAMPRSPSGHVFRVDGPIVLDWGNGFRLRISPEGAPPATGPAATRVGRPGRKPSAATLKLIQAMEADKAAGKPGSTQGYLGILMSADSKRSEGAARQIVMREAKRIFGATLGRRNKRGGKRGRRGGGRRPNPVTVLLREKLAKDKEAGSLRDAAHYVRWVVDQPGTKIGLKGARPIVYRELRSAR